MLESVCALVALAACGVAQPSPVMQMAQASSRQGAVVSRDAGKARDASLSGANPSREQVLVAAPAEGLSAVSPEYRRLYGPGTHVMDSLADVSVGALKGYTQLVSQRFRATSSGKAVSIRTYWPAGSGYSAGNGGVISVRIVADDGSPANLPDLLGRPVATGVYEPGLVMGKHLLSSFNDEVKLGSAARIEEGQIYHVVYENIAPDPAANWIGINSIVTAERAGRPARWLNPLDWASLYGYRPVGSRSPFTWKDFSRTANSGFFYAPILQVLLDNGAVIGAADIETGNVEGERQQVLNSNQSIRERFVPTSPRSISGFSVQTATTTGGTLGWSIRQGETIVSQGVISETAANYSSQGTQGIFKWYDIALPAVITMQAGGTYDLVFTPEGTSQWKFADQYSGTNRGFRVSFAESQAQSNLAGKWTNTTHRSHLAHSPVANWRVVLHLSPARTR